MATDYSQVPFGVSGDDKTITGRTTSNTTNAAILEDSQGNEVFGRTYGGHSEVSEDGFVASATVTNEATPGQHSDVQIVTGHDITESNQDYTRVSKKITKFYPVPSSSSSSSASA